MTFAQFDISAMVRCAVTDEEGFRCRLRPNHQGVHDWDRCAWTDDRAARCMLPLRHPGSHALFWYDEAAAPGTKRTLELRGSESVAESMADRVAKLAAPRGWTEVERRYALAWTWRFRPLAALMSLFNDPQGSVRVTFERRGDDRSE